MLGRANRSRFSTLLDAAALAEGNASQPALIFVQTGAEPAIVSRDEFQERVYGCASAFSSMGLSARDLVVIAYPQAVESIYAFWGALVIGAIPSMFPTLTEKLDPHIYMQNMAKLVTLSGVDAVLTTEDFAPQLAAHLTCPVYDTRILQKTADNNRYSPRLPDPDEIAFLQHSSGTTGLQKGVALSHRAVLNQLASYSDSLRLNAQDVVVSWLPLYHDMGLIAGFLLPLFQGIPLVIMSPFDWVSHPALLLQAIDRYHGTLCWLPNFAYNHLARRTREADVAGLSLSTIRAFINCSEPVRYDSHQMFLERFGAMGLTPHQMAVCYAMAENVFAVTQTTLNQPSIVDWIDRTVLAEKQCAVTVLASHPDAVPQVSCGEPIAGVELQVVDSSGAALPDRHLGEIEIRTDSLLTGYYHRDDLKPLTADGWYQTGDRGYTAEGQLYVVGRSKDLIINAGKNIFPQDIEAVVNTVPGVHPGRVVVFGVQDEREGTELIAVIAEVDTDNTLEQREINRQIRQTVSQQSLISVSYVHLVQAGWLIKTSSGKVARAANRAKWLSQR